MTNNNVPYLELGVEVLQFVQCVNNVLHGQVFLDDVVDVLLQVSHLLHEVLRLLK